MKFAKAVLTAMLALPVLSGAQAVSAAVVEPTPLTSTSVAQAVVSPEWVTRYKTMYVGDSYQLPTGRNWGYSLWQQSGDWDIDFSTGVVTCNAPGTAVAYVYDNYDDLVYEYYLTGK